MGRPGVVLFAALVAVAVGVVGCSDSGSQTSSASRPVASATTSTPTVARHSRQRRHHHHHVRATTLGVSAAQAAGCPSAAQALDGVYHPERLLLKNACTDADGVVVFVRHEQDGDLHIDVALDGQYRGLLDSVNYSEQHGDLVVEFMARDGGHLPAPSAGDRIRLVGAWVDDTQHGWDELHPVWRESLDGGTWHASGPQFGGSPAADRSYDAAADCRTSSGGACPGYGSAPSSGVGAAAPAPVPQSSSSGSNNAGFCSTHRCIASFDEGTGYIVQCNDGMWSHSGGRPGACSDHGGESGRR